MTRRETSQFDDLSGFSLLRLGLPAWAERDLVILAPGESTDRAEGLQAAIIVLERGQASLETAGGGELILEEGAVFCLSRLPFSSVRNVGDRVVVLATSRRRADVEAGSRR